MSAAKRICRRRSLGILAVAALYAGMLVPNRADAKEIAMTKQSVQEAFTAQLSAMVAGDTKMLAAMLDKDFVLTHLTGYRQPKEEWLAQMRQGQFIYHSIDEVSVTVDVTGTRAGVVGDTRMDSTVNGWRREDKWRLRMAQDYEWRDGRWIALNCVTSLW